MASLIADVAEANQKLPRRSAPRCQAEQEAVNKALVDVQSARDAATTAQQQVDASAQGVKDATAAIAAAQQRFDTFAAATYVNGPSASMVLAGDPQEMLSNAAASQTLALSSQKVIADLQKARTEQVNKESAARWPKAGRPGRRRRGRRARTPRVGADPGPADLPRPAVGDRPACGRTQDRAGQAGRRPQLVGPGRQPVRGASGRPTRGRRLR